MFFAADQMISDIGFRVCQWNYFSVKLQNIYCVSLL